jgi:radical SAM superfamily enzyme YgiQ (UPF0313 family)
MKICLVRLPSPFLIEERAFLPLGLLAVGTSLKMAGHAVTIHDGPLADVPMGYDGYGMGPTTPEYPSALMLKNRIRRETPAARIVLGGAFATLQAERCLGDGWNCVVFGDGEPVADQAFTGREWAIHVTPQPLDDYPIIDRSLLNIYRYTYRISDRPATTMVTSRGCPWSCTFCCKTEPKTRLRSAEHVAREIDYLRDEFGYKALAIPDDIFILQPDRTRKIARRLACRDILWRCLVRADLILRYGRDFAQMMADAGCVEIALGIESGSPRILATIRKGETVDTIKQAIDVIHACGMSVKGFFMLGLPGESPDTIFETEQFLATVPMDAVDIGVFQPYPGSPIWASKGNVDLDWPESPLDAQYYKGHLDVAPACVHTSRLTAGQISEAVVRLRHQYQHAGA